MATYEEKSLEEKMENYKDYLVSYLSNEKEKIDELYRRAGLYLHKHPIDVSKKGEDFNQIAEFLSEMYSHKEYAVNEFIKFLDESSGLKYEDLTEEDFQAIERDLKIKKIIE